MASSFNPVTDIFKVGMKVGQKLTKTEKVAGNLSVISFFFSSFLSFFL